MSDATEPVAPEGVPAVFVIAAAAAAVVISTFVTFLLLNSLSG